MALRVLMKLGEKSPKRVSQHSMSDSRAVRAPFKWSRFFFNASSEVASSASSNCSAVILPSPMRACRSSCLSLVSASDS